MVIGEYSIHSVLTWFYSTTHHFLSGFRSTQCWLTWVGSFLTSWIFLLKNLTEVHQVAIYSDYQFCEAFPQVPFPFTTINITVLLDFGHCPSKPYQDSDWHSLKIVSYLHYIRKYPVWFHPFYMSTSYLTTLIVFSSIITDLNNTGQTLCLI